MTKAELITALNAKFHKVFTPDLKQTYDNIKYYTVSVFDKAGDSLRDQNIPFYVEDEGEPSEAAYWSPSEPKPDPVGGFQQEVAAYIAAKITDDTIEGAFPESIDVINENAIYRVVMPDLSEKRLFVDKDGNGDLRHRALV